MGNTTSDTDKHANYKSMANKDTSYLIIGIRLFHPSSGASWDEEKVVSGPSEDIYKEYKNLLVNPKDYCKKFYFKDQQVESLRYFKLYTGDTKEKI